jgi:hypothetical protein
MNTIDRISLLNIEQRLKRVFLRDAGHGCRKAGGKISKKKENF